MRLFIFTVASLMMTHSTFAQAIERLKTELKSEFQKVPGTFAVAMEDLQTGRTLFINERGMFHAASTMKTPVMVEVFKQAKRGTVRLDDSVLVKNEFRSIVDSSHYSLDLGDDSDDSMYKRIGSKATVRELVYHMITVSSNLATNLLIDLVDAKNVTATMRQLGARDIQVLRGVEDGKAFEKGLNNSTNAYDLMVIFRAIAEGNAVDSNACRAMVEILFDQKFRDKIPALLPKEIRVANKTGDITGVEHDSGIVFLPDGRSYVLVILSKDLNDAAAGKRAIATMSKKIYDYFVGNY